MADENVKDEKPADKDALQDLEAKDDAKGGHRTGDDRQKYMEIKLTDVLISGY